MVQGSEAPGETGPQAVGELKGTWVEQFIFFVDNRKCRKEAESLLNEDSLQTDGLILIVRFSWIRRAYSWR